MTLCAFRFAVFDFLAGFIGSRLGASALIMVSENSSGRQASRICHSTYQANMQMKMFAQTQSSLRRYMG